MSRLNNCTGSRLLEFKPLFMAQNHEGRFAQRPKIKAERDEERGQKAI